MLYNDRNTTTLTIILTTNKEKENTIMSNKTIYNLLRVASWLVFILAMKDLFTFNIVGLIILAVIQFNIKRLAKKIRKEINK